METTRLAVLSLLCLALISCSAQRPTLSANDPNAVINVATLSAPIEFLADDLLEGRGPGTRGDLLARRYIETEMRGIGLVPGLPDGQWEQPIDLVGISSQAPPVWQFHRRSESLRLTNSADFIAVSMSQHESVEVDDAELMFIGYGIEAPEYQWDDFKGVDVRGKVVVVLNNDPDWDPALFAGKRRLYYGRWTYKFENAARHGAAAAILIHTTDSAAYPWQTVQTSWSGENSRLPEVSGPELAVQGWITEDAARRLFAFAGRDLNQLYEAARSRDFRPVALDARTSLRIHNELRHYASANVVGALPGGDAQQTHEAIVYTAHHDHLGMKRDRDGREVVYNGAVDNAAGVAQLLAIARAFAASPSRPRRTVLFVALAAEEQGLLGSQFFVSHPPIAPTDMIADINFDGGNIWGRTRDVTLTGYGKSTIDRWAAAVAGRQGRVLVDERFPERGSFYRSDQFNFAKAGVPVLYAHGGIDYIGRPEGWGREQEEAWLAQRYHQPSDDFDPNWNWDGMIEDAQLAFEVGQALANSDAKPEWVPGDEFERARSQPR